MDSVEGEIFVVDGVESPAQHSGLHLVLLLWQQLQLHVRVAAWINQLQCKDTHFFASLGCLIHVRRQRVLIYEVNL